MTQLTLRGFDQELDSRLHRLARERGLSLNKAALLLMRRGAGLTDEGTEVMTVGDSLDEFIGSWKPEQEREVLAAIEALEQIDEDLWR